MYICIRSVQVVWVSFIIVLCMFLPVGNSLGDEEVVCTRAEPKTIIVDINGSGNYTSIQDAVDNASAGDTVRVWNWLKN